MSLSPHCIFRRGRGPIVAAAIHNGHDTRKRVDSRLALNEDQRRREEDPFTAEWTQVAPTQIIALRSRFEVDLNRPRHRAVYCQPQDAWGLRVWRTPPDAALIEASLREYDQFYDAVETLLRELVDEHGRIVVYDLHTYSHRRGGPHSQPADQHDNPQINVGTGSMNQELWRPVVDRFMEDLSGCAFHGVPLDVRENVRFQGGHFPQWIHRTFPEQVCAIAIEVKKFFMDEWMGQADPADVAAVYEAICATVPGVEAELQQLGALQA